MITAFSRFLSAARSTPGSFFHTAMVSFSTSTSNCKCWTCSWSACISSDWGLGASGGNGFLGILFLFAIRLAIPYFKYFLRHVYMLIRLYPISLDTYSTSSPSSKQRRSTSYLNSANGCLGWSGVLYLWSLFRESLPHDYAYSPDRHSGFHNNGKEWTCSDIPTVGSLHAEIPTVQTLSVLFLPVLLYTFSRLFVLGVQLSVLTPI